MPWKIIPSKEEAEQLVKEMKKPHEPVDQIIDKIIRARDAQWAIALGCPEGMTPEEALNWIAKDRIARAHNVTEARARRGPERW